MSSPRTESNRRIPDFSLAASTGQTLSWSSFQGKVPLLVVFLADVDESGDQALLIELNGRLAEFGSERSQALAVARLTARHARDLADELDLALPLLADAGGAMARDFEVDDGAGSTRTVAVVADRDGVLKRRFDPVPLDGSPSDAVDAFLETVRAVGSGALEPPATT